MALRSDRHRNRPIAALALDAGTTIGPRCATIHVGQEATPPPHTGRIYDRSRPKDKRHDHSLANREESIYDATIGPRCATIHVGREATRLRTQAGYTTATDSRDKRSVLACTPGGVHIRRHDWPAVRDYPCWPGGHPPPHTGRIYDRNRLEGQTVRTSLALREESIYGLLSPLVRPGADEMSGDYVSLTASGIAVPFGRRHVVRNARS